MEFVLIKYWRRRRVFVDGEHSGEMTNEVLQAGEEGLHRFALSSPQNYTPAEFLVPVADTTPQLPLELEFIHESRQ